MDQEEKDRFDEEWEEENVSRGEMLELMMPLVMSSSKLIRSVNVLGKAMVESGDDELLAAGAKSLALADDAMKELREFRTEFERIYDQEESKRQKGGGDGAEA